MVVEVVGEVEVDDESGGIEMDGGVEVVFGRVGVFSLVAELGCINRCCDNDECDELVDKLGELFIDEMSKRYI